MKTDGNNVWSDELMLSNTCNSLLWQRHPNLCIYNNNNNNNNNNNILHKQKLSMNTFLWYKFKVFSHGQNQNRLDSAAATWKTLLDILWNHGTTVHQGSLTVAEVTEELSRAAQRDCSSSLINDCSRMLTASCNDWLSVLASEPVTDGHTDT